MKDWKSVHRERLRNFISYGIRNYVQVRATEFSLFLILSARKLQIRLN